MIDLRRTFDLGAAVAFVVGAALLIAIGWSLGLAHAYDQQAGAAKRQAADLVAQFQAGVRKGAADAAALNAELTTLRAHAATLTERLSHVPLTVPRPTCIATRAPASAAAPAVARHGPGLAGDAAGVVPELGRAPGADAPGQDSAAGDADELTLGAVSVWNSALAGADVPAGACGLAGAPDDACSAGAGIGIEEVWANHVTNAEACAVDRRRYQRLIDHLQSRQQGASQ